MLLRNISGVSWLLGWLVCALLLGADQVAASQGQSPSSFLYELAQEHLKAGQEAEAIHELQKLLSLEPTHRQAQAQLVALRQRQEADRETAIQQALGEAGRRTAAGGSPAQPPASPPPSTPRRAPPKAGLARDVAPDASRDYEVEPRADPGGSTSESLPTPVPAQGPLASRPPGEAAEGGGDGAIGRLNHVIAPLAVSGEMRSTVGIRRDDLVLQEANGDLNERNFRVLFGPFRYNTFDPRVFSRLRVNLDTTEETPWQFHSNLTVDPWSFVGKTDRITVVGNTPSDSVELELKWWSATNTAINETFLTQNNGDSIAAPEIEVSEGRTVSTSVASAFGNTFRIPSLEVDYTFQPIRWAWMGYRNDVVDWRVFPLALEDQALTSDDPLHLSNHHIYWEPSPWLDAWLPGRLNVGATPDDITRGEWSDALTFFTRDSDLTRLTALRGTSLQWQFFDTTSFQAALASPKGLWQEYERFNSFVGMTRLKHTFFDNRASLGGLTTARWAYTHRRKDATNNVYALDASLNPWDWLVWEGEGAVSKSIQDRVDDFESDTRGWAWHQALTMRWWEARRLNMRVFYTHMDEGFDPGLANYRNTRKDQFWGRHLHLKRRLRLLEAVSPPSVFSPEALEAVRIGDGVDVGRDAIGLRLSGAFLDQRVEPLIDIRTVHRTTGKYLETVVRQENLIEPLQWLTAKTLFIYHDVPHTVAGRDPFVVRAETGEPLTNTAIVDDRDPSLTTYSLGAEVAPVDQVAVWGIWERTNDTTVATDNFPRGLLNETTFSTFADEDQVIRIKSPFLYSQGFFPQPPYPFFDIVRAGVYVSPWERFELSADWTRNEFEHAGQIDDNVNHIGFLAAWSPLKRLVVVGRYVASRAIDVTNENAAGGAKLVSHHSLYGRLTWKATDDSDLSIEFGEAALGPVPAVFTADPVGEFYPTLDTQHLVRIVYSAKF